MIRNFKRTASILGVVALGSAALVACGDDSSNGDGDTGANGGGEAANGGEAASADGLTGQTGELVGEGASSQQNAMAIFNAVYSDTVEGASLAYNPTGSGSGRTNFIAGQVDFAGSDSAMDEEEAADAQERCEGNEAWHLPMVIGPVAIAYNLDGIDDLNLTVDNLADIFSGEVTNWNDESIAEANPDAELPDQEISVIVRADESGTSGNFQRFLSNATDNWDSEGENFPVPANGSSAQGSAGVGTETNNIPGAITYVEYDFVHQNDNIEAANIDFGSGPVELNEENVNTALEGLEFLEEGHNMVVDTDALFSQDQEGSYPLILTVYSIVCSAGYDEETQNLVSDFFNVALDNQEAVAERGFIPVEGTHLERLQSAVDALGGGGEA